MNKKTCPICGDTHTEVTQTCIKCVAELGKIQPMPSSNIAPDGYKAAWNGTELVCVETELHKVLDRIFELETNGSGGVGGDDEMSAESLALILKEFEAIKNIMLEDGLVKPTPDVEDRLTRIEGWLPPKVEMCSNCGIPVKICNDCGHRVDVPSVICINCGEASAGMYVCSLCGQNTTVAIDFLKTERDAKRVQLKANFNEATSNKKYTTSHLRYQLVPRTSINIYAEITHYAALTGAHTGCCITMDNYYMYKAAVADTANHKTMVALNDTTLETVPALVLNPVSNSDYYRVFELVQDLALFAGAIGQELGHYEALMDSLEKCTTLEEINELLWTLPVT